MSVLGINHVLLLGVQLVVQGTKGTAAAMIGGGCLKGFVDGDGINAVHKRVLQKRKQAPKNGGCQLRRIYGIIISEFILFFKGFLTERKRRIPKWNPRTT